jgi:hypothetical protein
MANADRKLVPAPKFGFFRDGAYQAMEVGPTGPALERQLPAAPSKNPIEAAAEFSRLLRKGTEAE